MANTTENDWDETSPSLTDARRAGATEITSLRKAVGHRLAKEHVDPATGGVGGEHKEGSAKAYFEASAPTLRPDGSTALDSDDAGRLWVDSDTNELKIRTASGWAAPVVDLQNFTLSIASLTLPATQSSLAAGTWLVFVPVNQATIPSPTSNYTVSVTINGTVISDYIAINPGGNAPLVLAGTVTVTGAGTISITASSNVSRIHKMIGIRVGP